MPYTVHSIGRTMEEQAELRVWMPWMRHLQSEAQASEYEFGNHMYEHAMIRVARTPQRNAHRDMMLKSDCAICQSFAGMDNYPSHEAPMKGHRNHCSCDACW